MLRGTTTPEECRIRASGSSGAPAESDRQTLQQERLCGAFPASCIHPEATLRTPSDGIPGKARELQEKPTSMPYLSSAEYHSADRHGNRTRMLHSEARRQTSARRHPDALAKFQSGRISAIPHQKIRKSAKRNALRLNGLRQSEDAGYARNASDPLPDPEKGAPQMQKDPAARPQAEHPASAVCS